MNDPIARPAPRLGLWARRRRRRIDDLDGTPAATHGRIRREADLEVAGSDGTPLLTDHWYPAGLGPAPAVLLRTPYGRQDAFAPARAIAERGFHVVVQSARGTFGSGGGFEPFWHEAADGRAALAWVRAQPWSNGIVETIGGSYDGLTQWSLIDGDHRPQDGLTVAVSSRRFDRWAFLENGGFNLETQLTWLVALTHQERPAALKNLAFARALLRFAKITDTRPVQAADQVAIGEPSPAFQDWVAHCGPGDPWWERFAFAQQVDRIGPTTLLAGWNDLFLAGSLDDYARLREAGRPVRLVVGDWDHFSAQLEPNTVRALLRRLVGTAAEDPPVRVQLAAVKGDDRWLDLTTWPPPATPRTWSLAAADRLTEGEPGATGEYTYRYDPADPTPSLGGRSLHPLHTGRKKQAKREKRGDVLTFTSPPLDAPLDCVGEVAVDVALTSTNPGFDVFLRLCDVGPRGTSVGVVDAYRRAPETEDGLVRLTFPGIAYRFGTGHRVRLQVSSGAHPLHLRNAGHDDPVRDQTRLVPSDQRLRVGDGSGSRLVLPCLHAPS